MPDPPNFDNPDLDLDQVIEYGIAVRSELYGAAEELGDPAAILADFRRVAATDPVGAICALFSFVAEESGLPEGDPRRLDAAPNLARLYWDWQIRADLRSDPDLKKPPSD